MVVASARLAECYMEDDVDKLYKSLSSLGNQVMMQQMFIEERLRATGSGFRQIRSNEGGSQPWHVDTLSSSRAFMAMHAHRDYVRSLGVGEVQVVMNGVEFRTRHEEYKLMRPVVSSKAFQATQAIPFPEVPPQVLAKKSVSEQVEEMQEWFRAFKNQDHSVRDYRHYFKANLCYMEGYWIYQSNSLDRDVSNGLGNPASDWEELHEKVRFNSYSGAKTRDGDLPFLPVRLMELINDTFPVYAQWTYRVVCHPLKHDLPTNRLHLVDDLTSRVRRQMKRHLYESTRLARFQINPRDSGLYVDESQTYGLLDSLMSEIPGLDNYGAHLENDLWGSNMAYQLNNTKNLKPLNAAYYHRWHKDAKADMMGSQRRSTGFNDPHIFMAMNNQSRVAGLKVRNKCSVDKEGERKCKNAALQKWSYALPLEIVYTTPLSRWNPYNINYYGDAHSPDGTAVSM